MHHHRQLDLLVLHHHLFGLEHEQARSPPNQLSLAPSRIGD